MALILTIHFPPGISTGSKLVKFKADDTVEEAIKEIITSNKLAMKPNDYLLYLPQSGECPKPRWTHPSEKLSSYNLSQKSSARLAPKNQVVKVYCQGKMKTALFNYCDYTVGQWLPFLAKKFDIEDPSAWCLYISGEKEPLKGDVTLCELGIHPPPDIYFDLRRPDDAVEEAKYGSAAGKKKKRPPTTGTLRDRSAGETKSITLVNLQAPAQSLTEAIKAGWFWKQNKRRFEKRWFVLHANHLFYYKGDRDPKPAGVINLYGAYRIKDGPKKRNMHIWELVPTTAAGMKRGNYILATESDTEKKEWLDVIQQAIDGNAIAESSSGGGTSSSGAGSTPRLDEPVEAYLSPRQGLAVLGGRDPVPGKPKKGAKLFGGPLTNAVEKTDGSELPALVINCIKYIEERAMTTTGIFRLSGSSTLIEKYVARYDKGEDVDLSVERDPHCVAGILKLYLRELEDPVMTFRLYPLWIGCAATKDRAVQLSYARHLLRRMPPLNQALLEYLLQFLLRVAEYKDENKMELHNLATVLAPNLLRKQEANAIGMVVDTPTINSIVNTLTRDFEYVFRVRCSICFTLDIWFDCFRSHVSSCFFCHLFMFCFDFCWTNRESQLTAR
ncbi:Rho GTPase-activating protein 45 [Cleaved into: Minor histocompatibility antigen HA-1] [Balamuthia mandrillaris]